MSPMVFLNPKNDHIIVFNASFWTRVRAGLFGAIYYTVHGMPGSFVWAALFYFGWYQITKGELEGTFQSMMTALGWRSAWHFMAFDDFYPDHLRKIGFERVNWPDQKYHAEIEKRISAGFFWRQISPDAQIWERRN